MTRGARGTRAALLGLIAAWSLGWPPIAPAEAAVSAPAGALGPVAAVASPAEAAVSAPAAIGSPASLAPAPPPTVPQPGLMPAAADGLDVATATSYVVDPAAREIRVDIGIDAANRLPVTAGARYYYPGINLAVQPEADGIAADEHGVGDRATTQARDGYRLLTVELASPLYAGQTVHLHLAYVLPAGAPRSTSGVRVGAAHASFVAWAFGDRGTVSVRIPGTFSVTTTGDPMQPGTGAGAEQVLSARAADPATWYAAIDARNDAALTSRTLQLPGGEQLLVRAWPEDPAWERRVSQTLASAIPVLAERIGLPWPVTGETTVLEASGSLLEGYAGFYAPGAHQITISEALDPLTIVHEASHAWFNAAMFADRWITEGLADEYAFRTLQALGQTVDGPPDVRTSAAVAFPLDTWGPPAAIRSRAQDTREQWAYDASWTVVREIVREVGEPGMAKVFAAAEAGTTAYAGSPSSVAGSVPERSSLPGDWRRFLDLAEEVGGGRGIAAMIAPWVLTPAQRAGLAARSAARAAYHRLAAMDDGWSAPVVARADLDGWDFTAATAAIDQAGAVIRLRDAMQAEAASMGLSVPADLEAAYEGAASTAALASAMDHEAALSAALDALAGAEAVLAAPRDWLTALGLLGQDPASALASARSAWAAGDAATASQGAASAARQNAVAADAGRMRAAVLVGLIALVLVAAVLAARRRRGRVAAADSRAGPGDPTKDPTDSPPVPSGGATGTSGFAAGPGPSPILPANAAPGPEPEPMAGDADGGAE